MKVSDNVLTFGTLAATGAIALGSLYLMNRNKKKKVAEPVVETKEQTFQIDDSFHINAEGVRCKIKDVN